MKLIIAAGLLFVSGFFTSILHSQTSGDFLSLQRRMIELYEENHSAMVRVKAVYEPEGEEEEDLPQVIIGSGFFISREGLILTNASIVYEPVRVWIEHQNIAYAADIIGADLSANLALLRVRTLPKQFNYFHLADTPDLPVTGTFLFRLSMPLELPPSPDMGLVAGKESRFADRFFPCVYIRTNIPAGPGDGGSAYMDLSGRLLGIQVGSLADIGSSYVLPARAASKIRDDLLFAGEVRYGWIGFEIREQSSIEKGSRILLAEVLQGTPAAEAGLLAGDHLLQIGDYAIQSLDDLRNAMFYTRVGQYVEIRYSRDGKEGKANVKVAKRPSDEPLEIIEPTGG